MLLTLALIACTKDTGSDTGPVGDTDGLTDTSSGLVDTGEPCPDVDEDGDGFRAQDDCDDGNADVNPDADEACNGVDDDCDGDVDENAQGTWYLDADQDGYGDPDTPVEGCDAPSYATSDASDCDDLDASTHPGADETCDGEDDDCDDDVDEEPTDGTTYYEDADRDGYGNAEAAVTACDVSDGVVEDASDCHDDDATAYPRSTETETPGDGVDTDCDGEDACLDANCDGQPDLLFANYWSSSGGYGAVSDLLVFNDGGDFSTSTTQSLSTNDTWWSHAEDLDQDGYTDLVLVQSYDGSSRYTNSSVYWGSASGYSDGNVTDLYGVGAVRVLAEDLDGDGWTDLFLLEASSGGNSGFAQDSTIYWGSASGYSSGSTTDLATTGAWMADASDLDQDGYTDLVVCNYYDDSTGGYYDTDSTIFWGSASGFNDTATTGLPTSGCRDVEAADLDGDGWDDLVFANTNDNAGAWQIDSPIYWNDGAGNFSSSDTTGLLTSYSHGLLVDDLDADGDLDVAFGSLYGTTTWTGPTYVYWNQSGFASSQVSELEGDPTYFLGSEDLDGDGYPELILPGSWSDFGEEETLSRVYAGSASGFVTPPTELSTWAPGSVTAGDLDGDGYPELAFPGPYSGGPSKVFWGSSSGYSDSSVTELDDGPGDWAPVLMLGNTSY